MKGKSHCAHPPRSPLQTYASCPRPAPPRHPRPLVLFRGVGTGPDRAPRGHRQQVILRRPDEGDRRFGQRPAGLWRNRPHGRRDPLQRRHQRRDRHRPFRPHLRQAADGRGRGYVQPRQQDCARPQPARGRISRLCLRRHRGRHARRAGLHQRHCFFPGERQLHALDPCQEADLRPRQDRPGRGPAPRPARRAFYFVPAF